MRAGRKLSASWRRDDEPAEAAEAATEAAAEAAAKAQLGSSDGQLRAAGHFEHAGPRPGGAS